MINSILKMLSQPKFGLGLPPGAVTRLWVTETELRCEVEIVSPINHLQMEDYECWSVLVSVVTIWDCRLML